MKTVADYILPKPQQKKPAYHKDKAAECITHKKS